MIYKVNKISRTTYLVAAFQSRPHHVDIPYALKTVVNTTISEINDDLLNWFVVFFWVHKLIGSKLLSCKVLVNIIITTLRCPLENQWKQCSGIADSGVKKASESYQAKGPPLAS